ncbi:DUF2771 domain-containing protein [Nocardia jejuensis]|uniref:DUF2771 domain-containing protein n=1 Tax=Nocardia jejuensis TaxID=328049 RepID=UPI0008317642|nr:DUF2771 domain-containing protein [Nocardia jejuensis]
MSQPKARTIVAILAALLVVAVAYFAVIVVSARNVDKPEPEITAYAHGKSVTVTPFMYCSVHVENNALDLRDCDNSESVSALDVPAGYPLQLSLPKEIVDAPWQMVMVYGLPDGTAVQRVATHRDYPEGARAITIDTPADPRLQLAGVEVQLPVPARDENGNEGFIPHAIWSIRTSAAA